MRATTINKKWTIILPDHRADTFDERQMWEVQRFESMERHLKPGMVLLDVGCEQADISIIFAKLVGAENMCLFEGLPLVWPNIRQTWEANGLAKPKACFAGLVSDKTDLNPPNLNFDNEMKADGWPGCSVGEIFTPYDCRYIHAHADQTPQTTLDDWCARTGIFPDAVTMDIEGAELLAMQGAKNLLNLGKPMLLWISVHPELLIRDYHATSTNFNHFMEHCGYRGELLGIDHENHVLYRKV